MYQEYVRIYDVQFAFATVDIATAQYKEMMENRCQKNLNSTKIASQDHAWIAVPKKCSERYQTDSK